MSETWQGPLEKIDDYRWRIPKSYKPGMRVPGLIYADEKLLKDIYRDKALEQVANVAFLPGIVNASLAMPDIHWGYGFCIGGVAATDPEKEGVISPAGVGYDINCGVRLLKTNFQYDEIKDKIKDLVYALFSDVPSGVGSKGDIRVSAREEREILIKGAKWAVEKGYGTQEDLECTEEYGAIAGADPSAVSDRAYERGKAQSGTLGSGNHFLEIQVIDQLYGRDLCDEFGLDLGQITIMIHSGSRGLGYQVCDDYTKSMIHCLQKYNINVPDRQLACAPVNSQEGKAYLGAMKCAANYAWANRQCLMHLTRKTFERIFAMPWQKMGMSLIYDVAHNIAKIEKHKLGGEEKTLCIHRKGATRAFGPGHPALPERYKKTGQPVIIPGDMGRNSYLLVGTQKAMEETFGSTCHGAGRVKSRTAAARSINLDVLLKELESKGIIVKASGRGTIVEEAPQAYKDVNEVVDVVHNAGISKRVCRMKPLGVIKG
jgi:tRNA-splicing ligase RtcB